MTNPAGEEGRRRGDECMPISSMCGLLMSTKWKMQKNRKEECGDERMKKEKRMRGDEKSKRGLFRRQSSCLFVLPSPIFFLEHPCPKP